MKIVIAGLGSIGRRHLKNLSALGIRQLAAVTNGRCSLPSEELPPYLSFTGLDAALAWRPDAVFVRNPTALHLDTALAAVRAGCHLFLEQPVSNTLTGLDELSELVEKQGVKVQVGFQFQYPTVFK
nr:Gfo/Idh/MocA family oxidoreductase [Saprospiraceae bacterium]